MTISSENIQRAGADAVLAERLRAARRQLDEPAGRRPAGDTPPVTSLAQEWLWLADRAANDVSHYHVHQALRLHGPITADLLGRALRQVVARHQVLRTRYREEDGQPVPVVEPHAWIDVDVIDVADRATAMTVAEQSVARPFDLAAELPLRVLLVRAADGESLLLTVMHHLVTDGWSMSIFWSELAACYRAFAAGTEPRLPRLDAQYADFGRWQRTHLTGQTLEDHVGRWRERLAGMPALALPVDREPATVSARGGCVEFEVSAELADRLRLLGGRCDATLFSVLLAGYVATLGRWSGQREFAIGTPVATRPAMEFEPLIGFFMNTVALRAQWADDPRFEDLIRRVRAEAIEAHEHQDVPFGLLVQALQPVREPGSNPYFQVMFTVQQRDDAPFTVPGVTTEPVAVETGMSEFALNLTVTEHTGGLTVALRYAADRFDAATIGRLGDQYRRTLADAVDRPDKRLSQLSQWDGTERDDLLALFSADVRPAPPDLVHELIAVQAGRRPGAVAVRCGAEHLTYSELERRANQLAAVLRDAGAGPERMVAVGLDRSPRLLIALLAVLKSGAAYVPVDPRYPADRISYILTDSGAPLLLTTSGLVDPAAIAPSIEVMDLDVIEESAAARDLSPVPAGVGGQNLAYCVYTSGSTGRPKGVMVPHTGLANLLADMTDKLQVGDGDVMTSIASPAFDMSVPELFLALINGGAVELVPPTVATDGAALARLIDDAGVTIVHATPTTWRLLLDSGWAGRDIRAVAGAEAVPSRLVTDLIGKVGALWNFYGPTECTVWATAAHLTAIVPDRSTPLGRPLAGNRVLVLDDNLAPVPPGTPGEIYLAGTHVTRGYRGRPGLTAERFVPDPFRAGGRLYRTGDHGRWWPDGRLEYLDRADNQVKIRGHRIELEEIEARLEEHPAVARALVRPWGEDAEARLVGYVVPESGPIDADLIGHLREQLPYYMVPAQLVEIAEVPLTPNGKVNRGALPEPADTDREDAYVAPRTALERIIADSWSAVLGHPRIGVHDNFFGLGGHSLSAIKAAMRLREATGVQVPLPEFFTHPTVAELARHLSSGADMADSPDTGVPAPLSNAQRRLWWLEMLRPGSTYNVSTVIKLNGPLDPRALARAVDVVVERHEILRSRIESRGEAPVQIATPAAALTTRTDLSHLAPDEAERQGIELARRRADEPFRLEVGPPMRAEVITLGGDRHLLVVVIHHVVVDGWSMPLLWREVALAYHGIMSGRPAELPHLPLQYGEYARRQQEQPPDLSADLAYWRRHLEGSAGSEIPVDHPRPAQWSGRGDRIAFDLPDDIAVPLRKVAQRHGVTLYMLLLAGFKTLLARYTQNPDVVVGTPVAGRNAPELEPMIGCFVNTLVLRGDLSHDPTFAELLTEVRTEVLEAYMHQEIMFEQLVEELNPPRDPSRNPMFGILFQFEEADTTSLHLDGVEAEAMVIRPAAAKFDLSLGMVDRQGALGGSLEYAADLFDRPTIRSLVDAYLELLRSAVTQPHTRLSQLALRPAGAPLPGSRPVTGTPSKVSATARIAAYTLSAPNSVAIEQDGITLTYAELDRRANQLAHWLDRRGVGPETRVALIMSRSPELVVSMLAVLKCGATLVPLDPAHPRRRRDAVLAGATPAVVLTQSHLAGRVAAEQLEAEVLAVDGRWAEVTGLPGALLPERAAPDNTAAIYHTSGSTGLPKGILTPYRGIANYLGYLSEELRIGPDDVVLQLAGVAFDASLRDILGTLAAGARLVMLTDETAKEPRAILDAIDRHRITALLALVPSMVTALARTKGDRTGGWDHLRVATVTGEVLLDRHVADARHLNPGMAVYNQYGPTECTITSTYQLAGDDPGPVPIGVPIPHAEVRILDEQGSPVPAGAIGELCLSGPGLVRGYLGLPGLTAERFLPDPYGVPGARMYRTGDLARLRSDGTLAFHGRNDDQLKVRGVRIEPGEIEAALVALDGIRTAAVKAFGEAPDVELIAFLVAEQRGLDVDALPERLGTVLPTMLLPNQYVVLDSLPLTANGKVDRKRLEAPSRSDDMDEALRRPRTPAELRMVRIWERVLGKAPIGITDNFFAIGGHSLKAVELVEAIRAELSAAVPLTAVFTHPTVEQLAGAVEDDGEDVDRIVHLLADGDAAGTPLFLVHPGSGDVCCYSELARVVGGARKVYGIESVGYSSDRTPLEDIAEMASVYITDMKKTQPQGPYLLAGWSFGGNVAFEMVAQLEAAGDQVGWLGILDARAFGRDAIDDWYEQSSGIERFGVSEDIPRDRVGELAEMEEEEALAFLLRNAMEHGRLPRRARTEVMRRMVRVFAANGRAADNYRLEHHVNCPIHLFKAVGRHATLTYPSVVPETWQERTSGPFSLSVVGGHHHNLVFAPHVGPLGSELAEVLDEVEPDLRSWS